MDPAQEQHNDRPSLRPWARWLTRGGMLLLVLSGCFPDEAELTSPVHLPGLDLPMEAVLTSNALAQYLESGRLSAEPQTLPEEPVSESQALELAVAFISHIGREFLPTIERQAGRRVQLDELTPDPRVLIAETPYARLPPGTDYVLRAWSGPAYVFTFSDRSGPAVAMSVSAYAREITVLNGQIIRPVRSGNEFRIVGLDANGNYGVPFSAEDAARAAHATFGLRVSEAPRFVRRGVGWMPFVGSWKLELEDETPVRTANHGVEHTRTVHLEPDGTFSTPISIADPVSVQIQAPGVGTSLGTQLNLKGHPRLGLPRAQILTETQPSG